jgi:hypothetical protein
MKNISKKKLEWNQQVRMSLILLTIAGVGIILSLLVRDILNPGWNEIKETRYTYHQKANIFYRVFLRPNVLYGNLAMEAGDVYITEFVDSINTFFEYNFQGQKNAQLQGDYEVLVVMEGYRNEEKSYESIWKQQWIIVPKTKFESNGTSISLKKEIPLDFKQYNQFAQQVVKDAKVNSDIKMTVFWNVHLKGDTAQGVIEENISPSMMIPLNTNYFKISGNLSEEKPGNIDEIKRVKAPVDKRKLILYSVSISVLLIVLAFLILFTTRAVSKDPFEKEFRKILKKHGSRLIALNNRINFACKSIDQLKCMDDLVKMADEIGKPILYQYSDDLEKMIKFYVLDNEQAYVFDLKNVQFPEYEDTI